MKYANKKSKREFVLTFCALSKEHYTVCVVVYDTYSGSGNLTILVWKLPENPSS